MSVLHGHQLRRVLGMNDVLPEARSLSAVKDWSFRALALQILSVLYKLNKLIITETLWAMALLSSSFYIWGLRCSRKMPLNVHNEKSRVWFFSEGLKFCTTLHIPSTVLIDFNLLTCSYTEINNSKLLASPFGKSAECYNSSTPLIINHRWRNKLSFSLGENAFNF